jgi:hypothetical protein
VEKPVPPLVMRQFTNLSPSVHCLTDSCMHLGSSGTIWVWTILQWVPASWKTECSSGTHLSVDGSCEAVSETIRMATLRIEWSIGKYRRLELRFKLGGRRKRKTWTRSSKNRSAQANPASGNPAAGMPVISPCASQMAVLSVGRSSRHFYDTSCTYQGSWYQLGRRAKWMASFQAPKFRTDNSTDNISQIDNHV